MDVSKEDLDLAYEANEFYDDLLWLNASVQMIKDNMADFFRCKS